MAAPHPTNDPPDVPTTVPSNHDASSRPQRSWWATPKQLIEAVLFSITATALMIIVTLVIAHFLPDSEHKSNEYASLILRILSITISGGALLFAGYIVLRIQGVRREEDKKTIHTIEHDLYVRIAADLAEALHPNPGP
jgi:hypothetical protein